MLTLVVFLLAFSFTACSTTPGEVSSPEMLAPLPSTQPEPVATEHLPDESSFSIHFIDVGQADAALVQCDDHYMLIDGGNKEDSNIIYSVLQNTNVPYLDIVVGTHGHEDHIGGLPGAYSYTTALTTLCSVMSYDSAAFDDFARYAEEKGGGITVPNVGDTYSLGSADITIIGVNSGEDTNDSSIVLKIQYGDTSFLFTGDAERPAEEVILDSGYDLSSTVLKVGHHGASTSTRYPFLREIMPKYAVISVGEGNTYGHPTDETLSRLRDADVTVYRTDLQGDIFCTSDGSTVSFSTSKNTEIDTLSPVGPNSTQNNQEDASGAASVTYVVNTNSGKFHYPSCSSVEDINPTNKLTVGSAREELVNQGFSPCGICKP